MASGSRFTWSNNAQPALLKNSTRSRPQGRNADAHVVSVDGVTRAEHDGLHERGALPAKSAHYPFTVRASGGIALASHKETCGSGGRRPSDIVAFAFAVTLARSDQPRLDRSLQKVAARSYPPPLDNLENRHILLLMV